LAQHHDELVQVGTPVVGISIDDPGRHAAMLEKLQLPFPLLSDPGGAKACKPYDAWDEESGIAKPATILVDTKPRRRIAASAGTSPIGQPRPSSSSKPARSASA
jgi:peroxiredoxin